MSLPASPSDVMPAQPRQGARAAFPKGNPARRMRDARAPLYTNPHWATLFAPTGRPADAPAQRALLTIGPLAAGLSDAQAAEAGRARIAWQDALALDGTAPGCEASVLSELRPRLRTGQAALLLCETRWTRCRAQGLRQAKGRPRTDATPGLAAIETRNRLAGYGGAAKRGPAWGPAVWCARSGQRLAPYRLPPAKPARATLATQMGMDGHHLRGPIDAPATPAGLREVPARQPRRQGWRQPGSASPDAQPVCGRHADDWPPAPRLLSAPDAPEARDGQPREPAGTGDKGPGTAPWADETPKLIPAVVTTPAPTAEVAGLPTRQDHLATRQVTPRAQCVAAGEVSAAPLWTSRPEPGLALRGPVPGAQRGPGQAAHGFAAAQLVIAWDAPHAICPPGQRSVGGMARPERHGHPTVRLACSTPVGAACPSRADGPRAATAPRALRLRARDHAPVLQAARVRQQTAPLKKAYARRAGLEGTSAQGPRTGDLRRSRASGWGQTRRLPRLLAAALHFLRVAAWLAQNPRARTPAPALAALSAAAASQQPTGPRVCQRHLVKRHPTPESGFLLVSAFGVLAWSADGVVS